MFDFGPFDRLYESLQESCKHEEVGPDGVCEECCEIQWYPQEPGGDGYQRASYSSVSKHSKLKHFEKFLDRKGCFEDRCLLEARFVDFEWAFDRIDKGTRKNFLLNGWVFCEICRVLSIDCEKYVIKNNKSREEHEKLGKLVFKRLGWETPLQDPTHYSPPQWV